MIHYRIATAKDSETIIQMCQEAYAEYPIFTPLLPYFDSKEQFLTMLSRILASLTVDFIEQKTCLIGEVEGEIVSVAMLQRPNVAEKLHPFFELAKNEVFFQDKELITDYVTFFSSMNRSCEELQPPHWHLDILVVDKRKQGKRLGSKMIHQGIIPFIKEKKDKLLTLITNTEQNRIFYQKNGFSEFASNALFFRETRIKNWSYKLDLS